MKGEKEKAKTFERLQALQGKTASLLEALARKEQKILEKPGKNGGWSVMQILSHMMQSEQLSYRYVKKKLSFDPELQKVGFVTNLRALVLKFLFSTGIKIGAPKGLRTDDLKIEPGMEAVKERWAEEREKMRVYLDGLNEDLYLRAIFKHPLVGKLSLSQMMGFFEDHLDRHTGQIQRRLKE